MQVCYKSFTYSWKKKKLRLLFPCKPSFSTESLWCGGNLRSQHCSFNGWPSRHLSFIIVVEDSGKVSRTDALVQTLLPENGELLSLVLELFCTAFRVFVLTKVIRQISVTARNISKITPWLSLSFFLWFTYFSWTPLPSAVLKCHPLHKLNSCTLELMIELSHNTYTKRFKPSKIYWWLLF